jgi:signal transduction histidine kinase
MAAEPKRVMLLHSFGPDFRPWSEYARAIRAELERQSPWPLDLYEYSLVSARSSDENPEIPFVAYLSAVFSKHQPDLIVSIGAPAAAFVQRHRRQLFPAAPMLLTVVDQRRVQYSVLTENDAVAAVSIDYSRAIENILRVLPDTKTVAVVVGNSPIEKYWKEEIAKESEPFKNRLAFTWYDDLPFQDILKHAAALPPHSAIFWELMLVDAAGVSHEEGKALRRLHAVANAPIFSYTDAFFGREIVGGPHVPVLEAGRQAAEVAVRILGGEKAGNIKMPPVGFGTPKYDWRELERWGISERLLPPGSEIYFRTPTAWDQYREQILAAGAAIVIQAALIAGLLIERRRRRRSDAVAHETRAELAHAQRFAVAGELSASIAHEVNQPLAGIVASANAAQRWLAAPVPDLEKARAALTQIVGAGHRASDVVRGIRAIFKSDTAERHSVDMNDLMLAVLALAEGDLKKHQIRVEIRLDEYLPAVEGDRAQLQQVLLNLISNAVDSMASVQSGPRTLRISSEVNKAGEVLMSVEDTGTGISPEDVDRIFKPLYTTKSRGMGMGLSICRTIVESHHGRIWATSEGSGALIQVALPALGQG